MGGKRFDIRDNHESIDVLISNLDTGVDRSDFSLFVCPRKISLFFWRNIKEMHNFEYISLTIYNIIVSNDTLICNYNY